MALREYHALLQKGVRDLLTLPRGKQLDTVQSLRASLKKLGAAIVAEEWNTRFDPESLYDAVSEGSVFQGVYSANVNELQALIQSNKRWRIIEVGGGNGKLWKKIFHNRTNAAGDFLLVDTLPETHDTLAAYLPKGVDFTFRLGRIEDLLALDWPDVDAIVCSLTLHHVPGRSASERARHGMSGQGKLEVLHLFAQLLQARDGSLLLNEADICCELSLPPGDEVLKNNIVDSYVRRFTLSLLDDIKQHPQAAQYADRWAVASVKWGLGQLDCVVKPLAERDVYELSVVGWMDLLDSAGLQVVRHGFTDQYCLFHQYVCRVDKGQPRCGGV